jgi:hypothetical protein
MKTFEEKWTAWIDGELTGKELEEFEASLPNKAAAEAEKRETKTVGALLKEHLVARALTNEEFFIHQIREQIAAVEAAVPAAGDMRATTRTWWTIPRLLWTGAASLAIFVFCTVLVMREKHPTEQSQYLTQVLNARVDPTVSPGATISIFETKEEKVTVLWTEGLESLPADYAAK